jgi:hypothetical protein
MVRRKWPDCVQAFGYLEMSMLMMAVHELRLWKASLLLRRLLSVAILVCDHLWMDEALLIVQIRGAAVSHMDWLGR